MAEEHRVHAPPLLCANNCGFFGSPATQNLCSKCHKDLNPNDQPQQSSPKLAFDQTRPSPTPPSSSTLPHAPPTEPHAPAETSGPSRCGQCRRRVGLTGFRCRCGMTLCGAHRYAEQHGCGFDFKAMDREAISRANPVVKGDKLHKI